MSIVRSIGSIEERLEAERSLLGATSITILARTDGDRLAWWHSVGVDHDLAASWAFVPLDPGLPVTEVVLSGTAQFYETSADLLTTHPRLVRLPREGASAAVYAPIIVGDVTVGVWVAKIPEPYAFTETRRTLARALAADWAPHLADRAAIAATTAIDCLTPEDVDTEAMLRALVGSAFDHLVGAIAVTSTDDRFLAVNDAACTLLGRSKAELKRLSFRDITHPDDGDADDHARAAVVVGDDPVIVRKRFIRPDGTSVTVDVDLARLLSPTGRWLATLVQYTPVRAGDVTALDITDITDIAMARARAEALAEIAGRLASTDRTADVATAVEDIATRVLHAAVVTTALFEQGYCRLLSVTGLPRATINRWEHFPLLIDLPITRPHRTGRTHAWQDAAALRAAFPQAADDLVFAGVGAMAVLPLRVDDELIGCLGITWRTPCALDDDEMQWLETLASILGQTLDRVRRAERDRHAAMVLQQSLLPDRLEPPMWLDAAARYRAAGDDTVGGDLYDLVHLDDGDVAVIVADVCGRGVEAAAGTAAVRHTLRAALLSGSGAADALARVDVALRHVGSDELALATAVVAVISPPARDGTSVARVTTAGHPPVLVRHADGRVSSIGGSSLLLGLDPSTELRPTTLTSLQRGDVLVAYTDGLTDTPHPRLTDADVAAMVAEGPADPDGMVAWLLGRSHAATPGDDTALIAIALR